MTHANSRRAFLKQIGTAAVVSSVGLRPALGGVTESAPPARKQRFIFVFSPNGTVPSEFWPDDEGSDFKFKKILEPLEPFKAQTLIAKGICNEIRGDGDGHMRGMAGLLTGIELLPGNIQGGSDTPAGWAGGISIDQEIKNFLQANAATRTRFGSLEFGVGVANRADPWTRLCYADKNRPVAPISNPYSMFERMYGRSADDEVLRDVLADVQQELQRYGSQLPGAGEKMVAQHVSCVRQMQRDLKAAAEQTMAVPAPELPDGARIDNDNLPQIAKMQIDLLVNGFANDLNRVATLQFSNSVGQLRMKWEGIDDPHHTISHDPDMKVDSQKKLVKINRWFCSQIAYLLQQMSDTKEPGSDRSLLDDTILIWGNELGKGNSHTRQNLPIVMVGNAPGFTMGRYKIFEPMVNHNRLHLSLAHAFGHKLETFGNPKLCEGGPLDLS